MLQTLLGYARWENFLVAINRAVDSCITQGINVDDHFREVTKMVSLGSGAQRPVQDFVDVDAIRDFPKYISNPIFVFRRDSHSIGILTEMLDSVCYNN